MKNTDSKRKAFTLIELLIVVAIIGILAAIAVPNFMNAQIRASIARVKADFRTFNTAIESYHIDNNDYIPDMGGPNVEHLSYRFLTTPISYISSTEMLRDHFTERGGRLDEAGMTRNYYDYGYQPYIRQAGVGYVIISFGPTRGIDMPWNTVTMNSLRSGNNTWFLYDASNGLVSRGDIISTALGIHNR